MVTHVHALILDLDHPALEVLLVEQQDLHRGDARSYTREERSKDIISMLYNNYNNRTFLNGSFDDGTFLQLMSLDISLLLLLHNCNS